MNVLAKAINDANIEVKQIYRNSINHKGMKLTKFRIKGFDIVAFTKDHANNIYQQTLIDVR